MTSRHGNCSWLFVMGTTCPGAAGFPSQIASNTELWRFNFLMLNKPLNKLSSCRWFVMCTRRSRYAPGRDLMRERTRSRIQYGGRQMRHVNTVQFLPFYQCFRTYIASSQWVRERTWRCANELFLVPTNDHIDYLLHCVIIYKSVLKYV